MFINHFSAICFPEELMLALIEDSPDGQGHLKPSSAFPLQMEIRLYSTSRNGY